MPKDYDIRDKVKIFSSTDERIKFIGKMLNSDYSMDIWQLLSNGEMTANEIAEKTGASLPLVIHHLNTMLDAGIVSVASMRVNSKNQSMKCYTAKTGILILPEKSSLKAKESKSLSNSLTRIMKFAGIGFAGIISWMAVNTYSQTSSIQNPSGDINGVDPSVILDGKVSPVQDIITSADSVESLVLSIIIPVIIVASGIILERILTKWFSKKRQKIDTEY